MFGISNVVQPGEIHQRRHVHGLLFAVLLTVLTLFLQRHFNMDERCKNMIDDLL
jgi:hypothetical protein